MENENIKYPQKQCNNFTPTDARNGNLKMDTEIITNYEDVIISLEDTIDKFCDYISGLEAARAFIIEIMTSEQMSHPHSSPSKDSSESMIFYDAATFKVLPFEHILHICSWVNDHSIMRKIPGMEDIYYLFEEGTEITAKNGIYLLGPIVVIRLNAKNEIISPAVLDRHRIRKFIKDHTEKVKFEEGTFYEAFCLV